MLISEDLSISSASSSIQNKPPGQPVRMIYGHLKVEHPWPKMVHQVIHWKDENPGIYLMILYYKNENLISLMMLIY